MKQTINYRQFEQAFKDYGREKQFLTGLRHLFDYLQDYEDDTGEELELDVIALCCDYVEDSLENVLKEYGYEDIDELRANTIVIEVDDETVIYQNH